MVLDDFQDMLKELREISPNRTRAECKLLLRRIKEVQAASQVTVWVRFACRYIYIYNVVDKLRAHVHAFIFLIYFFRECLQNSTSGIGLLHQLNVLFPLEFRTIEQPFLHERGDTTVVKATHKVSLLIAWLGINYDL